MKKIRNIIFDFGGVLYDIDLPLAIHSFRKIGITKDIWSSEQDNLFNQIETGKIRFDQILDELRQHVNKGVTDEEIKKAFQSVLVNMPYSTVDMLKTIAPHFKIFLLSNTNHAHVDQFEKEILEDPHNREFFGFFEKTYYSFEMGLRKPDPEIYKTVLLENELDATETLFVDDSEVNLNSAARLGIKVFLFEGQNSWETLHKYLEL